MKRSSGYSTEKRTQILEYLVEHKDEDVSVKDIEKYLTTKEKSLPHLRIFTETNTYKNAMQRFIT